MVEGSNIIRNQQQIKKYTPTKTDISIGSMYGVFNYILLRFMVNVIGKYTIHVCYGIAKAPEKVVGSWQTNSRLKNLGGNENTAYFQGRGC